jgi:hypothetical protein
MHLMDNDERDRRDWPEGSDETAPDEPAPEFETLPPADDRAWTSSPEEEAREATEASPADIESWPSQDATPVGDEAPRAWPTEPPAAGSATGWPTEPPERGDEPVIEPAHEPSPSPLPEEPTAAEWGAAASTPPEPEPVREPEPEPEPMAPPPSEVEGYPAAVADEAAVAGAAATAAGAHAVPADESAAGESTQCPRCGTENRPGLAFCRNCGQRLVAAGVATTVERPGTPEGTMACPRCGTHNRAGVAFCQNCGANLRGTTAGYVPPAAPAEGVVVEPARRGAVLGPVVLLIGLVGLVTGYLLPFAYGGDSLLDRAFGPGGYGVGFWSGYGDVGGSLVDQAYFGLAGPVPLLGVLVLLLAIGGFVRAVPGPIQMAGLVIALLWSVGLIVLFVVVEVAGAWGGDIVGLLRDLTPAGIIFFLASLIILIGVLTRFGRS